MVDCFDFVDGKPADVCRGGKDESGENRELVYKVDIKDEIGPSIWRLVKRSFDRATDENADVILVHMNT